MTTIRKSRDEQTGIITHVRDFGDSVQLSVFIPRNTAKGCLSEIIDRVMDDPYYGGPGEVYIRRPSLQRFCRNGVRGFIVRQLSGLNI